MTIAEQIYTLVQSLPQDKASQVLTFAESIRGDLGRSQSGHAIDELPWVDFVYSLAGAWGDQGLGCEGKVVDAGRSDNEFDAGTIGTKSVAVGVDGVGEILDNIIFNLNF